MGVLGAGPMGSGIAQVAAMAGHRDRRIASATFFASQVDFTFSGDLKVFADEQQIKKAFRRLAQQWHPDVNKEDAADERFKAINEAYQILSDPERRQRYDLFGSAGVEGDVNAGFGVKWAKNDKLTTSIKATTSAAKTFVQ